MKLDLFQQAIKEYTQLYSVVALFCPNLTLRYASPTVKKYIDCDVGKTGFFQLFDVHRPARANTLEDIHKNTGELFLLIDKRKQFAIRGQILRIQRSGRELFVLLGGPWYEWVRKNSPHLTLSMSDFSRSDPQLDMLFLMSSNDQQMRDLEELAAELTVARDDAIAAKKARSEFFAVMSHEMRTPLNGVISAINLLEDSAKDSWQSTLLATASGSAQNLMAVINHVLDFSKLEAGKLVLSEEPFSQRELLQSVLDICKAKAAEKSVYLAFSIEDNTPLDMIGDQAKLRQVLINLVSNALKFTDRGSVIVSVKAEPIDEKTCHVRYDVKDTGIGISEEDKTRLFDIFWSAAHNTTTDASTGLGLHISQRLVDAMGGKLLFDSTLGKGSEFWFEIALARSEQVIETTVDVEAAPKLDFEQQKHVLLVDDNATNLLLGQLLLEKYGLVVETATNGKEAVDEIAAREYDLVFMDISMPIMDGVEATRLIKGDVKNNRLPIVALTAHAVDGDRARLLGQGLDDYLTKPIEKIALSNVLLKWLGGGPQEENKGMNTEYIDSAILSKLVDEVGEENISLIVDMFCTDVQTRKDAIDTAVQEQDVAQLAHQTHAVKGGALSIGAVPLSDMMQAAESAAKASDIDACLIALQGYQEMIDNTLQSLKQ